MNYLSPSILSADFMHLQKDIDETVSAGCDWLHIDVMDGVFVPSISYGMPILKQINEHTDTFLDVHLMITEPGRYVQEFIDIGADLITVHFEASHNIKNAIHQITSEGARAGLAINPETSVEAVFPYLKDIDMLLIMTVRPGFGGQKYLDACTSKIKKAADYIRENNLKTKLEVDGGINFDNLPMVLDAGANVIVAGSSIFRGDIAGNTKRMLDIMRNHS
ncbi:MAG: ribulose-phosphate 3-epimerase [Lachnospiraceae bacterium]|nr:ribulose-phosphate 3-epimerase [Lachnospiraceae bacterium]MCR5633819.1 ribulose-phosphate 3-epimerase [Lachnospiraceae bacterium]